MPKPGATMHASCREPPSRSRRSANASCAALVPPALERMYQQLETFELLVHAFASNDHPRQRTSTFGTFRARPARFMRHCVRSELLRLATGAATHLC